MPAFEQNRNPRKTKIATTDLSQTRRLGYLLSSDNKEEEDAWYLECARKRQDCIIIKKERGGRLSLDCYVAPNHAMSDLGYAEVSHLLTRLSSDFGYGSFGLSPLRNCSEFSLEFQRDDLDLVLSEVREILLRDRTPTRRVEVAYRLAPLSGMARAVSADGLWEGHQLKDGVYIQEIPNQPGYCVALKNGHLPLVGLPMSQFHLIAECDV